jgi:hypothetical protein
MSARKLYDDTVRAHAVTVATLQQHLSEPLKLLLQSGYLPESNSPGGSTEASHDSSASCPHFHASLLELQRQHEGALRTAVDAAVETMRRENSQLQEMAAALGKELTAARLQVLAAVAESACMMNKLENRTAELHAARAAAAQSLLLLSAMEEAHNTAQSAWHAKFDAVSTSFDIACAERDTIIEKTKSALAAALGSLRQLRSDHEAAGRAASDAIASHVLRERHLAGADFGPQSTGNKAEAALLRAELCGVKDQLHEMIETLEKSFRSEEAQIVNAKVLQTLLSEALAKSAGAIAERDSWRASAESMRLELEQLRVANAAFAVL